MICNFANQTTGAIALILVNVHDCPDNNDITTIMRLCKPCIVFASSRARMMIKITIIILFPWLSMLTTTHGLELRIGHLSKSSEGAITVSDWRSLVIETRRHYLYPTSDASTTETGSHSLVGCLAHCFYQYY